MKLRFACPSCKKKLQVDASSAGKRARCKHCQSVILIPTPTKRAPQPETGQTNLATAPLSVQPQVPTQTIVGQPVEPNSPQSQPGFHPQPGAPMSSQHAAPQPLVSPEAQPASGSAPLFGPLPEFQNLQPAPQPQAAPLDPFQQTMMDGTRVHDPTAQPSQLPINPGVQQDQATPVAIEMPGDNFGQVLDGLQSTVQAAVVQQHQRNVNARSAKVSVTEIQNAFLGDLSGFDRQARVSGRLFTVACMVVILPALFSAFVVLSTVVMFVIPYRWFFDPERVFPHPILFVGYWIGWFLLLAAWVPVKNLFGATLSLFSGPESRPNVQHLTREQQPVMYEFVDQICQKVGAPTPTRIDLDCEFNASASFRRGFLSFGSNDLVLTLGVPLIASQSSEQLASVIAHEFGHFRQGSAMRSDYLVRHLTGWFMESAFWGQLRADIMNLYDSEASNDMMLAFFNAIGFVGRKMMWLFGYVGHIFAGSLSREMEYDADRHAFHLAGSQAFCESMANVERYAVAHEIAILNAQKLFGEMSIMVQNIPRFTLYIGKTMPAETIHRIARENEKKKQDRLDTHPPTRERVAAAMQANQAGILRIGRPATDLIHDWESMAQAATTDLYSDVLGQRVSPQHMTPLEQVLRDEHKLLLDRMDT